MSDTLSKNLETLALDVRREIEPHYSEATICPGYKADKLNPALGQCGITSYLVGKRFHMITGASAGHEEPQNKLDEWAMDMALSTFPPHMRQSIQQIMPQVAAAFSADKKFKAKTEGFADKVPLFNYGSVYYGDTLLSNDHCWLRIVSILEAGRLDRGYTLETTLDQFSSGGLQLPPTHVQPADPDVVEPIAGFDQQLRYVPESQEFVWLKTPRKGPDNLNQFEERLDLLEEKVNAIYRVWEHW